ncbi:hypothetical protein GCM10027360_24130 [Amycolatopsis echigonensis]
MTVPLTDGQPARPGIAEVSRSRLGNLGREAVKGPLPEQDSRKGPFTARSPRRESTAGPFSGNECTTFATPAPNGPVRTGCAPDGARKPAHRNGLMAFRQFLPLFPRRPGRLTANRLRYAPIG